MTSMTAKYVVIADIGQGSIEREGLAGEGVATDPSKVIAVPPCGLGPLRRDP